MKRMARTTYEYQEKGFLTVVSARGAFVELLSPSSWVISSVVLVLEAFITTDCLLIIDGLVQLEFLSCEA